MYRNSVPRNQACIHVWLYCVHMNIGVEEGWITPPQKVGQLGAPLRLKIKRRSIDVLNEDRGK